MVCSLFMGREKWNENKCMWNELTGWLADWLAWTKLCSTVDSSIEPWRHTGISIAMRFPKFPHMRHIQTQFFSSTPTEMFQNLSKLLLGTEFRNIIWLWTYYGMNRKNIWIFYKVFSLVLQSLIKRKVIYLKQWKYKHNI